MTDLTVTKVLAQRLATQYPGVYVGSPLEADSIVLPAILMEIDSEVVVGSALQRATLKASVQSSADDSTPDGHAVFAASVDAFIRAQTINESGVYMWPPVASRTANAVSERHWETSIEYTLGLEAS